MFTKTCYQITIGEGPWMGWFCCTSNIISPVSLRLLLQSELFKITGQSLPNFFIFLNYLLAQNLYSIPAFVTQNLYHNLYVHCPWYNICLVRHQETVFALEVVNSGFKFSSATENQYRTLQDNKVFEHFIPDCSTPSKTQSIDLSLPPLGWTDKKRYRCCSIKSWSRIPGAIPRNVATTPTLIAALGASCWAILHHMTHLKERTNLKLSATELAHMHHMELLKNTTSTVSDFHPVAVVAGLLFLPAVSCNMTSTWKFIGSSFRILETDAMTLPWHL